MSVVEKSVSLDEAVALRDRLQGVLEWEAEAGALTAQERAAGEALLYRLMKLDSPAGDAPDNVAAS
ncbi:hypothetical protein EFY87_05135 [Flexivirga caeni]|uniref:Uncharacterized protein n=2 Tax=Flexivirga caeni TaxID=2294115 RepID=A0A3M9MGQ7_9MICO|nr:hypothetical protein EFY87_05135 [Flexivirga caeni]